MDGHEIGNHTFSHVNLAKCGSQSMYYQIERPELELDLLGYPCSHRIFRPPYSACNSELLMFMKDIHEQIILWNIDSGDWRGIDAESIINKVLKEVKPGSIIVFHDSDETDSKDRTPTITALRIIIPSLQSMGYKLVTVSEILRK